MLSQSLPVNYGIEVDYSRPPTSAAEYILRVRRQAEQMPLVLKADVPEQRTKLKEDLDQALSKSTVASCPSECLPPEAWALLCLKDFSDLRQFMDYWVTRGVGSKESERRVAVPAMKDFLGWAVFFFGNHATTVEKLVFGEEEEEEKEEEVQKPEIIQVQKPDEKQIGDSGTNDENEENAVEEEEVRQGVTPEIRKGEQWLEMYPHGYPPYLTLILQFDQVLTQKLLEYWALILEQMPISRLVAGWIYALLARLQWPLHRDTSALLRAILRCCCQQRSQLCFQKDEDHVTLSLLNTLILITGAYYKQGEIQYEAVSEAQKY